MTSLRDLTSRPGPVRPTVPALSRAVGAAADVRLQDPQALDEIDLYGDLVIAASSYDGPLPLEDIDRILGVI